MSYLVYSSEKNIGKYKNMILISPVTKVKSFIKPWKVAQQWDYSCLLENKEFRLLLPETKRK